MAHVHCSGTKPAHTLHITMTKKKNENERKRADLSYDTRRRIASYFKKRNERNNNKERKG